jgi:hypothetical protein
MKNALPLISHVWHLGGTGKNHEYPHSCQPATSIAIIYLSKRSQDQTRSKIIDKYLNNSVQKVNVWRTGNLLHHVAISRVSVFISPINIRLRTVNAGAWRCRICQQHMTSGQVNRSLCGKVASQVTYPHTNSIIYVFQSFISNARRSASLKT